MPGGLGAFAFLVAAAALLLVLLLVWLLSRDRGVYRTSFGFYIERRRYDDAGVLGVLTGPDGEDTGEWPKRTEDLG